MEDTKNSNLSQLLDLQQELRQMINRRRSPSNSKLTANETKEKMTELLIKIQKI